MKRLLCILCAALLLCACVQTPASAPSQTSAPAPVSEPAEDPAAYPDFPIPEITGYAGFSDVLAAKLLDGTQNKNLSPISVYLALAMVAEGAKGQTQADMLKLLGCESLEALRGVCGAMLEQLSFDYEDCTLQIADSIWMADRNGTLHFDETYLKVLAETYRSEANAVDFADAKTSKQIADWITEHTRGKIKISEDAMQFDPETLTVLINTIYLKAAWTDRFYEGATAPGTFNGIGGEQEVSYMRCTDSGTTIVQGKGFLHYSRSLLGIGRMTFVLPDEGTALSDLLGSPERIHALLNDGEAIRADVDVMLPKFAFQDRFDLNDPLKALGIEIAFSDSANFSGMCDLAAKISRVIQESYVGVDENGVEAAAYTMVAMNESAMEPEDLPTIDFHLTRPFLFVIEARDGTVLFIGTVTSPTPAE